MHHLLKWFKLSLSSKASVYQSLGIQDERNKGMELFSCPAFILNAQSKQNISNAMRLTSGFLLFFLKKAFIFHIVVISHF